MDLETNQSSSIHQAESPVLRAAICDSLPLIKVGLQAIAVDAGFAPGPNGTSLTEAEAILRSRAADILIVDKAFGSDGIVELLEQQRLRDNAIPEMPYVIVTGFSFSKIESLRFMSAGARGILRKGAARAMIAECLRAVAAGERWIEPALAVRSVMPVESAGLTRRERQVLPLVERGLTNKAIAAELGISAGTVKLHLKHIFEKTGLRGRRSVLVYYFEGHGASYGEQADNATVSVQITAPPPVASLEECRG